MSYPKWIHFITPDGNVKTRYDYDGASYEQNVINTSDKSWEVAIENYLGQHIVTQNRIFLHQEISGGFSQNLARPKMCVNNYLQCTQGILVKFVFLKSKHLALTTKCLPT